MIYYIQTGRTPLQCFKRYQRSLNTSMMRSKWTAEEDRTLEQAVKRYGEKNWQQGKKNQYNTYIYL